MLLFLIAHTFSAAKLIKKSLVGHYTGTVRALYGHCTGIVQDLDVVTKCPFGAAGRGPGSIGAATGLPARIDGTHIVINRIHLRKTHVAT